MNRSYTVEQLAAIVGGTLRGAGSATIHGVADIVAVGAEQASWVSSSKYAGKAATSAAGVLLVPKAFGETPCPAILCDNIDRSVAKLLDAFAPPPSKPPLGVHPTAMVDPGAKLGREVRIGPHVVIESGAVIGDRCVLHAGVSIAEGATLGDDCELLPNVVVRERCRLGHRVIIHPNSCIGADGFGYYFDQGRHNKVPHTGGVMIEDDVEIGACCCVDRAKFGHTTIGAGTKIDNQVHVAHNVKIGRGCLLLAQSGVAGSARIGDFCVLAGRAATLDGVVVGDGATIATYGCAVRDIAAKQTVSGFPAQEHRDELRERAMVRRLPKLLEEMKALAERVAQLEGSTDHRP